MWHTPFVLTLGRQKQTDLGVPDLYRASNTPELLSEIFSPKAKQNNKRKKRFVLGWPRVGSAINY